MSRADSIATEALVGAIEDSECVVVDVREMAAFNGWPLHREARGGHTPDKRIAFYCGTGWRASEAFFYAYLMGWATIAVYDGGWWAWVQDPANPIAVGHPSNSVKAGL